MNTEFDPYHRWLGIPPKHQPADYYRLLGLERFEDDPEVIVDAAERQIAHVRRYQLGQHVDLSQRILNELAAAKACLLTAAKKAEYDRKLREQAAAQEQLQRQNRPRSCLRARSLARHPCQYLPSVLLLASVSKCVRARSRCTWRRRRCTPGSPFWLRISSRISSGVICSDRS